MTSHSNHRIPRQGKNSPTRGWCQYVRAEKNFREYQEDRQGPDHRDETYHGTAGREGDSPEGVTRDSGTLCLQKSDFTQEARGGSVPMGLGRKVPTQGTAKGPETSETQI